MKRILPILITLLLWLDLSCQICRIDTLNVRIGGTLNQSIQTVLHFPIFRSENKIIDSLINTDIKNRFTNEDNTNLSIDSALIKWELPQNFSIEFEVTYLSNEYLSLNISSYGCGAYCSTWIDYFTYSLKTGQYLTIDDVIDTTGYFRDLVFSDKNRQYEKQRGEIKKNLLNNQNEIDSTNYEWILENYNLCDSFFELNTFALYPDHLEIIDNCHLPSAIKYMSPISELRYKYHDIRKYLKIKL